jgi:hypothetical protein
VSHDWIVPDRFTLAWSGTGREEPERTSAFSGLLPVNSSKQESSSEPHPNRDDDTETQANETDRTPKQSNSRRNRDRNHDRGVPPAARYRLTATHQTRQSPASLEQGAELRIY